MTIIFTIIFIILICFIIIWFWLWRSTAKKGPISNQAEVIIKDGVYQPDTLYAKANQPLIIHFILKDSTHCAATVLFPEFDKSIELEKNTPAKLEIIPTKTGTFTFACPMNMYKGKLIVE